MKGFGKAIARTPFMVTSKVGMAKKSVDNEFNELQRQFTLTEQATEKLIKEIDVYTKNVIALFTSAHGYAERFGALFRPIAGEFDLIGNHPDAGVTVKSVDAYESAVEDVRSAVSPELELIESRIVGPLKEFQGIVKTIRKTITKREHKRTDYDRHNNALTKLRDKKEKSLSDERNLYKLEQDFEVSTSEYDYVNNSLKNDLPQFLDMSVRFIEPLFQSFYYMQLNIYYVLLEKMTTFAEGKYDITSIPSTQIIQDYEEKRTDASQRIDNLNIIKKILSHTAQSVASAPTARLVQAQRANSGSTSASGSSGLSPGLPPSRASTMSKKPPPPPPSQGIPPNPPPPYTASPARALAPPMAPKPSLSPKPSFSTKPPLTPPTKQPPPLLTPKPSLSTKPSFGSATAAGVINRQPSYNGFGGGASPVSAAAAAAAAKRPPPPPPPMKSKPKQPEAQYVVALYDFVAQADGDLSFKSGDQIEIVERTANSEEWWTGKLNGVKGVFPGNYVQDA